KTKEEFMRVLEVNLVGTFLVCKYTSKYLDGGVIINVSSTDADDTYSEISMDYCASKAGVNSLTKTLSLALPNVRVISIMPPWVKTDSVMEMNPLYLEKELKRVNQKRLLEKEEVSNKILEIVLNRDIKSGSIVKIEGEHIVEYK
ncbi:MAG: SDR family oxidoreductase, partial [Bacilli bacterium]